MGRLSAQHFLPGIRDDVQLFVRERHSEDCRSGIADHETLAVVSNPVGVGALHTGGGPVPSEYNVTGLGVYFVQLGQLTVVLNSKLPAVQATLAQLLVSVVPPHLPEVLHMDDVTTPRPKHRPHAHLDGTSVGSRHNGDLPVLGQLEDAVGVSDGLQQRVFARGTAVRATQQGGFLNLGSAPSMALGGGTRAEVGALGLLSWFLH
mmetsp:Transcript_67130/g.112370  ORF Transcript_67130/g.112370 Transcript_67130/m.112370 type:complete len:205 (-) Transcript_67130:28-642(-)